LPPPSRRSASRADLYYRLNVHLHPHPAVAGEEEDIPLLVDHFIEKFNIEMGRRSAGSPKGP